MVVRLVGCGLVWHAGLGIEWLVGMIVLSIVAGWIVLVGLLPRPSRPSQPIPRFGRTLLIAAMPFAVLQLAQILALDGDLFVVSAYLPEAEAGHVAALSLFQRIQFFACFALASVLLPGVVTASTSGGSVLRAARPALVLFAAVAVPFLAAVCLWPKTLIALLVGPGYLAAHVALLPAALAATAFTASYLIATFLAALGNYRGIWLTAAIAILQLMTVTGFAMAPGTSFADLIELKAVCQTGLCAVLFWIALGNVTARTDQPRATL